MADIVIVRGEGSKKEQDNDRTQHNARRRSWFESDRPLPSRSQALEVTIDRQVWPAARSKLSQTLTNLRTPVYIEDSSSTSRTMDSLYGSRSDTEATDYSVVGRKLYRVKVMRKFPRTANNFESLDEISHSDEGSNKGVTTDKVRVQELTKSQKSQEQLQTWQEQQRQPRPEMDVKENLSERFPIPIGGMPITQKP